MNETVQRLTDIVEDRRKRWVPERVVPKADPASPYSVGQQLAVIIDATMGQFGLTIQDITGEGQSGNVPNARAVIAHMARRRTNVSWKELRDALGWASHGSAIDAANRMTEAIHCQTRVFEHAGMALTMGEVYWRIDGAVSARLESQTKGV